MSHRHPACESILRRNQNNEWIKKSYVRSRFQSSGNNISSVIINLVVREGRSEGSPEMEEGSGTQGPFFLFSVLGIKPRASHMLGKLLSLS
jgi:hypothetical protein